MPLEGHVNNLGGEFLGLLVSSFRVVQHVCRDDFFQMLKRVIFTRQPDIERIAIILNILREEEQRMDYSYETSRCVPVVEELHEWYAHLVTQRSYRRRVPTNSTHT